jgi:glycosyltransferase involved in cell wall biosynthesis
LLINSFKIHLRNIRGVNLKSKDQLKPWLSVTYTTQLKKTKDHSAVLLIDNDGFSYYTSYLACGLAKYREIILYGLSKEYYVATGASREKRIKFHSIEEKMPKGDSTILTIIRPLFFLPVLFEALIKSRYGIVHFQDRLPLLFLFLPFLKLKGKQICWELHDVDILPFSKGLRGKLEVLFVKLITQPSVLARYADKIIVHSSTLKKQLVTKGVDEDKIYVILHFDYCYLLNSNTSIRSDELILSSNYILFFGDIVPWKGIDVLINATRIVRKRTTENFKVLLAGKAYRKNVSYFQDLTQEDYEYICIRNKWVTSSEIPVIFKNAIFLVLPYTKAFEGSVSGVVPLAYTFSKPVIVSNVGSMAEYVEHNKTGFIFEPGNSVQLAEYIIQLIEDNSKCIEMGRNAYQKMLHEMSLERCSYMINDLYDKYR